MLKKIPVHEIKQNGRSPLYFAQDFEINTKRFFYVLNMKKNEVRGAHAHKETSQLIWVISGAMTIEAKDRSGKVIFFDELDKNSNAILFNPFIWLDIKSIKNGTSFFCLADKNYSEKDYIRNFKDFLKV